jgi:D-glycero-alpha-D-manno-heptose-7-phosphate kinase
MSTELENATVAQSASIEEALRRIDANKLGIVFAVDEARRVVGVLTDGDVRRQFLKHNNMTGAVAECMTREFVFAERSASREHILKLLDHQARVVPVLDRERRLIRVCTRDQFHLQEDADILARARAPARISFGGGGSDLTHHFFEQGGMVVSATIAKYAHASLRRRSDMSISIYSHDLKQAVEVDNLTRLVFDGKLDLIKAVVRLIAPTHGFELEVGTDFPVGSGLGGSASLAVAIIGCFNEFRPSPWSRYQIAEMAFQAERLHLNIPGGWQDQYAAAFGGFNYMEFSAEENIVTPLRLDANIQRELEACIILCHTGNNHNSGAIHDDQKKQMTSSAAAQAALQRQKDMTGAMKRRLLRGDLQGYGALLHEAWKAKRELSSLISNDVIDEIYEEARQHGALGGKILGAGGGGYLMLFTPPFRRYAVTDAVEKLGYTCERITLDDDGMVAWKIHAFDPADIQDPS